MVYTWNKLGLLSAAGAVCSLAVWLGTSVAKEETSVLVGKPTAAANDQSGPVLPPPSNPKESSSASSSSSDPFIPPLVIPKSGSSGAKSTVAPPVPPQSSAPTRHETNRPFMRPAEPRSPAQGKLVVEESMPAPAGAPAIESAPEAKPPVVVEEGIRVAPTPKIDYDTDHEARRMYRVGKIDLVMLTKDPTNTCAYEIPMCIPACCVGDPAVSARQGIFGRGIVEYRWACGFRAIVKFRHVLGDIRVDYEGD